MPQPLYIAVQFFGPYEANQSNRNEVFHASLDLDTLKTACQNYYGIKADWQSFNDGFLHYFETLQYGEVQGFYIVVRKLI